MKQDADKMEEAQENRKLADILRTVKGVGEEDQEALYGIVAMLGGLELFRFSAVHAESWGNMARGLADELAPHIDGVEAVLKKYRDGILYVQPEEATA